MDFYQTELQSPVGIIYVLSDGTNLRAVDFEGYESRMNRLLTRHYGKFTIHQSVNSQDIISRFEAYLAGDLAALDSFPVATNGTDFQRQVWAALRTIPAGKTVSYATIAAQIGRPAACRAVGLANGSNPIGIVVPCHRVVGSNNSLTGYGGGIERKQWLLEHEGAIEKQKTK